ncbi:MAG: hypothetical protein DRH37_08480, partial [Deltaproteobacteria bacterium]
RDRTGQKYIKKFSKVKSHGFVRACNLLMSWPLCPIIFHDDAAHTRRPVVRPASGPERKDIP